MNTARTGSGSLATIPGGLITAAMAGIATTDMTGASTVATTPTAGTAEGTPTAASRPTGATTAIGRTQAEIFPEYQDGSRRPVRFSSICQYHINERGNSQTLGGMV